MQVKLKNIGIVKNADININGLSVIAGYNDTGKSTIGKTIFSIIKSVSRYKEDLEESKELKIKEMIDRIYFHIRRQVNFSSNLEMRNLFYPKNFLEDILKNGEIAILSRKKLINSLKEQLPRIGLSNLNNMLEALLELYLQSDKKEDSIKRAFKKIFYSEFELEVLNKHKKNNEKSIINIKEYENEILNIELYDFSEINLSLYDELYFSDCTIIETPMILNFSDTIDKSKSYFEFKNKSRSRLLGMPNISFHIKDLDLKLKETTYFEENNMLEKEISKIIKGHVKYILSDREFVYIKKDGKKYKAINTANGIKSFGILQMLLRGGFINERSLVVIDEPEVHLHPFWQLKYAKILSLLIENGINILITTHSPYMLEAIEFYVKDVNFYFTYEEEDGVYIKNVNSNLDEIYKTLSEPFDELENYSLDEGFKW